MPGYYARNAAGNSLGKGIEKTGKSTIALLIVNFILMFILGFVIYFMFDKYRETGKYPESVWTVDTIPCALLVYLLIFTTIPLVYYIKAKKSNNQDDYEMAYNLVLWPNIPIYVILIILIFVAILSAR